MVHAAINGSVTQTNGGSRENLLRHHSAANTPIGQPTESFDHRDTLGSRRKHVTLRMPSVEERSTGDRVEMSPEFQDAHSNTLGVEQNRPGARSAGLAQKTNASEYRSRHSGITSFSNVAGAADRVHQVDLRSEDNRSLQRQIEDKLAKIQKIFEGQQQANAANVESN